MYYGTCVAVRGHLVGVGPLLPPYRSQGSNSGNHQLGSKRLYPLGHLTGLGLFVRKVSHIFLVQKNTFSLTSQLCWMFYPNLPDICHHFLDIYCLHLKSFGTNKHQISFRRESQEIKEQETCGQQAGTFVCSIFPNLGWMFRFSEKDRVSLFLFHSKIRRTFLQSGEVPAFNDSTILGLRQECYKFKINWLHTVSSRLAWGDIMRTHLKTNKKQTNALLSSLNWFKFAV